jgi:ATP-dependent DNA helicase RecG
MQCEHTDASRHNLPERVGQVIRSIPQRESLTVEFKSDVVRLSDKDLVAAVVCLANTDGGELYVGVEDDGQITGLHKDHLSFSSVAALIANRTVPPLTVRAEVLMADGLLDYSALPVLAATSDDFDPLERERLRQCIERCGGDQSLISLTDDEMVGALGLVRREAGRMVPTVAGLLILGRESVLREHLPTHELAFQVLQFARAHGRITRKDAATLCRIGSNQASRLLRKLKSENKLQQEGQGRAVIYVVPPHE